MLCDSTRKWLTKKECDPETGIPTIVTKHSEGIYSFQIFKPEYN